MSKGKELRIVFMGTPDFAVAPLRRLVEGGYNIVGVVTTPDKPAGRGLKIHESAVKQYAASVGLHIMQPEKLRSESFIEEMRDLKPDLAIVIAFRMLPEMVWSMPKLGTFNLHASLLPQYRGAAPINWAIINGDTVTGVTTFMLNHEIDKGGVLAQQEVAITPEDNVGALHDKLMQVGTELVVETIERLAAGEIAPIEQQECGELRPAPKLFKDNCRIDWSLPVEQINNLVRGLSPYPAAWSRMEKMTDSNSTNDVKFYSTRVERYDHAKPFGSIETDGKSYLKIACSGGYLMVDELQLSGKKRMKADELLRGFKDADSWKFA